MAMPDSQPLFNKNVQPIFSFFLGLKDISHWHLCIEGHLKNTLKFPLNTNKASKDIFYIMLIFKLKMYPINKIC